MNTFRFYKETDLRWYVDLPEWEGSKDDLEMVSGADTMLDILSQGELEINVTFSEKPFDNYKFLLTFNGKFEGGANYHLQNELFDFNVWLCYVTKFVFGYLPKKIYIA